MLCRRSSLLSRASMGAAVALSAACNREIVLGDSAAVTCDSAACGGSASPSGGAPSSGAGLGGAMPLAGSAPQAGSSPIGVAGCEPAALDASCDGLDEACEPTADDQGCSGGCQGTYAQGTSYMACLASADFERAEARCQESGMHLVKIDSAAENATVRSLALDDYVWIGGSNRDDPDVFVWLDGTAFYAAGAPLTGTYENFTADDPAQDLDLRCVQLRQNGTWSTWQCSGEQSFVCERY